MCDPATIALLATTAVSAGASLFGPKGSTTVNTPPAAAAPAIAAPTARTGGADVRVGKDENVKAPGVVSQAGSFKEKRTSVSALGGLGRGSLAL